ncbi:MAG: hypothetical protein VR73_05425 [Gammaproteobacteria bacterium BRH_c0]|nr:MAG: hypothetical protein VR73_05425 [Gammaproteobacteria bacterium BRH_c0]
MEQVLSKIPVVNASQASLNGLLLSRCWPQFRFSTEMLKRKAGVFIHLSAANSFSEKSKGRLLIIIMRPQASLTDCYFLTE